MSCALTEDEGITSTHLLPSNYNAMLFCSDLVIVVGGVIPAQDYEFLYKTGVHLVFGPGTKVTDAAVKVVDCIDSLLPDNEAAA